MIEFVYPWVFLFLPLILLCRVYCLAKVNILRVSNISFLEQAIGSKRYLDSWLNWIIIFLMIIALANPIKKRKIVLHNDRGYSIALLLDSSYSMQEDSRFKTAKDVLSKFIRKRPNDRIALEVFGDSARLASAMSYDKSALELILKHIKTGVAGGRDTALNEALFLGVDLFNKEPKNNRVMILLTDGIDTVKNIPLSVVIEKIKRAKIRVYTIGIGDDFKEDILKEIANRSNGAFFRASEPKELAKIYAKIDSLQKQKIKTRTYYKNISYYRTPLGLAIVLLVVLLLLRFKSFRLSWDLVLALTLSLIAFRGFESRDSINIRQKDTQILIALQASRSMMAKDLYPNRFKFAIHKVKALLDNLDGVSVGIILFSKRPWLLSPPISDYQAINRLLDSIDIKELQKNRANYLALLKGIKKLKNKKRQILVIFGDGEGIDDLNLLKTKLQDQNYSLFGVATATKRGSTILQDGKLVRDSRGDVVVNHLNPDLPKLLNNKLLQVNISSDSDMEDLAKSLKSILIDSSNSTFELQTTKREYWFVLFLALLIFIFPWQFFRGKR